MLFMIYCHTKWYIFLLISLLIHVYPGDSETRRFNENFKFGVSTSSYQIEGAWNEDGKSESNWDYFTHNTHYIQDHSNGDVACNSYHLYQRDIEMLKELNVDFYRFSISWSRILPTGYANNINQKGVNYYNRLINKLLENDIVPFVTIFHWDLPQTLQELGGWTVPFMADRFKEYADVIFDLFGDRVVRWITFNEPRKFCSDGYGHTLAPPALNRTGFAEYLCGHTVLRAHAKVYHLYQRKYKSRQGGIVGISLDSSWIEPTTDLMADKNAAERLLQFDLGWFAHPIFSKSGNYPDVMIKRVDEQSKRQGFMESRLPVFTEKEKSKIKGSADFFGLNHYTTLLAENSYSRSHEVSFDNDFGCDYFFDDSWPAYNSLMKTVPWGFRKILNWIKDEYDNPVVLISENGYATNAELKDMKRIVHINQYLNALLDAIEDGCNVIGYTMWSLMDNFEWADGYTSHFGLYSVDFSDPNRKRTPRQSAEYFSNLTKTHLVESEILIDETEFCMHS